MKPETEDRSKLTIAICDACNVGFHQICGEGMPAAFRCDCQKADCDPHLMNEEVDNQREADLDAGEIRQTWTLVEEIEWNHDKALAINKSWDVWMKYRVAHEQPLVFCLDCQRYWPASTKRPGHPIAHIAGLYEDQERCRQREHTLALARGRMSLNRYHGV